METRSDPRLSHRPITTTLHLSRGSDTPSGARIRIKFDFLFVYLLQRRRQETSAAPRSSSLEFTHDWCAQGRLSGRVMEGLGI